MKYSTLIQNYIVLFLLKKNNEDNTTNQAICTLDEDWHPPLSEELELDVVADLSVPAVSVEPVVPPSAEVVVVPPDSALVLRSLPLEAATPIP